MDLSKLNNEQLDQVYNEYVKYLYPPEEDLNSYNQQILELFDENDYNKRRYADLYVAFKSEGLIEGIKKFYEIYTGNNDSFIETLSDYIIQINDTYKDYGYVIDDDGHYFDIVNPNNDYYRATKGELPLTPENFLKASFIPMGMYEDLLTRIKTNKFPDTDKCLDHIRQYILKYQKYKVNDGYHKYVVDKDYLEERIRYAVNPRSLRTLCNINNTAEDSIENALKYLYYNFHPDCRKQKKPIKNIFRYGWNKEDIVEAIRASGLTSLVSTDGYDVPTKGDLDLAIDENNKNKLLPGFKGTAYMSRLYYETIYIRLHEVNNDHRINYKVPGHPSRHIRNAIKTLILLRNNNEYQLPNEIIFNIIDFIKL